MKTDRISVEELEFEKNISKLRPASEEKRAKVETILEGARENRTSSPASGTF